MLRNGIAHKGFAGVAIVILHGAALYALTVASPTTNTASTRTAVVVEFIQQQQTSPPWRPPSVDITAAAPEVPHSPVAEIEIADSSAANRAITSVAAVAAVTARDTIPRLISAVEYVREPVPRYPPRSRQLREQGVVVLRVVIDEQGRATSVAVESSSGYSRLDAAAREAVMRAAFRPYVEDGAPRRASVLVPIEFALSRRAA